MFSRALAYPDWPLNSLQLHLASAERMERTPPQEASPVCPQNLSLSNTGSLRGPDRAGLAGLFAGGARLVWGSF